MTIFKTLTTSLLLVLSLVVSTVFPTHAIVFNTGMAADHAAAANLCAQENEYPNVVMIVTANNRWLRRQNMYGHVD